MTAAARGFRRLNRIAAVAWISAMACTGPDVVRTAEAPVGVVSATYAGRPTLLRTRILDGFARGGGRLPAPFNRMTAAALELPEFTPDWAATAVDPGGFLAPYRQLSPAERRHDVLIQEPTGDVYWTSEYSTADGPVRFRCAFILHLVDREEPSRAATTTIQVYELVPTVWVGERWGISAHGIGFGRRHDIRFVEPTTKDRKDLLALIERIGVG